MATILLLDSYDSFTYNLKDYVEQCGAEVLVIQNDSHSLEEIGQLDFDGIILSPGPKTPEESGVLMEVLSAYVNEKPILGVCLGHQAIGLHFGINLHQMEFPIHGKVSILDVAKKDHAMFQNMPSRFEVCRYHSLVLEDFDHSEISPIAYSDDHKVMAIAHNSLPVWGVQFHPEAILTENGLQIVDNWYNTVKLSHR